jgi:hypothetical protein
MGGRGRGTNKRKGKGREKGKQTTSWNNTPSSKGKYGKGEKGKTQTLGSRKPKFTGTCSHCGIIGHMARDCYKRQQGTTPVTIKQNTTNVDSFQPTTHELKPALIQFQQFPTFVKRKLEGTNYHEPDESSSSNQDNDSHLSTDAPDTTFTIDDDDETDVSTWGTKTDTTNRDTQHGWGGDSTKKQTRHNSPDLNAYRLGQCTYCDCNIGSKRMHGPLICYKYRIFLKEDEEHDKEQQAYEERR